MSVFRRGDPRREPGRRRIGRGRRLPAPPDPDFPFLSVDDAARLRSLTRTAFAELGVETQIHRTHLEAADGHLFGFRNLFVACHDTRGGERAWRRAVRGHAARMIGLREQPSPADLPTTELLDHAVVRVCSESSLPSLDLFGYRRPLGGDLVELLAHDTPAAIAYLTDAEVERAGAGALRAAGVEHLLTEPFGTLHHLRTPQAGRFTVLLGESVHTASRLLTMDDVLRRCYGDASTPCGLLVAVPNRHQLAFHRPTDASLLGVIHGMLQFTVAGFDEGTGAISPHLFWRPPEGGPLEQLTRLDDDSGMLVRIQGRFAAVVEGLLRGGLDP
ncbi:MAG TPA: hypothetical protein VI248_19655 [Kineosporiaceae bacterium]